MAKEGRRMEEGATQSRWSQAEMRQGEDLPLVRTSHGMGHTSSSRVPLWCKTQGNSSPRSCRHYSSCHYSYYKFCLCSPSCQHGSMCCRWMMGQTSTAVVVSFIHSNSCGWGNIIRYSSSYLPTIRLCPTIHHHPLTRPDVHCKHGPPGFDTPASEGVLQDPSSSTCIHHSPSLSSQAYQIQTLGEER